MVTYSRLAARGGRGPAGRQEPYLEAREVPYRDDDLRAYDPERAAGSGLADAIDELDAPRRGRRRRGAGGAVLVGAVALAAGMVILAYAYGIATRVDAPSAASVTAPGSAVTSRGTLPADDAARSIPVDGTVPATASAPAAPAGDTATPLPAAQPAQPPAESPKPATAAAPAGSGGAPMDGDTTQQAAKPALIAPVPATATPPAPVALPKVTASVESPPAKPADSKPAASSDDLMANIERLLKRDAATAKPAATPAAAAGPTPLAPVQPADPSALPQLPDPNAVATTPVPPADVGPPLDKRLIPPADIPNVPPNNTATGGQ